MEWIGTSAHQRWLENEADRVFNFARAAVNPNGGFGWLDNYGVRDDSVPQYLWINGRMAHVYSLAALMGRPGASDLVDHAIAAIKGHFHDDENGGWYTSAKPEGAVDDTKSGYPTFFVVLGAAGAVAAGRPGGLELLTEALEVTDKYFWAEEEGMARESWDRRFEVSEPYRGGNVNMHAVEAYLAAFGVLGKRELLDKAMSIATRLIHEHARGNSYRVYEHFTTDWTPLPDYNKENPIHRFRAFGSTPGHWMEWARLLLHLRAELQELGETPPTWLLVDAEGLFQAALRDAWEPDGKEGFVYTVDWEGQPIVRERIRWVITEAIGGAYALFAATGNDDYENWYQKFWDYSRRRMMDFQSGSWWQELDVDSEPSNVVWDGKPDIYHIMHAVLVPRLPLRPSLAAALALGKLDAPVSYDGSSTSA
ncbi:AGE family epimerase/isomerase [Demequina lutea]|uniref:Sulfoquinovose isomerase n=1 Tax=Demequina lutea TaxID=431489 RepID=A0A7Z0CJ93_9MICO|nr:AGE family epimerase/isomerase [Demequina lutea]NYI40515.1 sulfoquinovose isomerase [Demequina lutea]